ncbi:MAG TPA: response regulator [bacterium]|jgi:CheY-like chemotaxis protein|nr:response regulator [bacterium]HQI03778.1 response regulator [bacterium]HQJ59710.1 response regulator [bacterium]HQN72975.1 response regulator [bacterium]HQO91005.1 response regulator [bacterium]
MVNKILIADDDVQMVNAVKTLLENVGYDTVSTNDPKEVIELARKEMPDLIMLDVMFEGMTGPNGFELSRKIASDKDLKKIPVIILSGVKKVISSDFEVTPDKEWLPVAAFLDKPVRPDQLLKEINNLIQKRS